MCPKYLLTPLSELIVLVPNTDKSQTMYTISLFLPCLPIRIWPILGAVQYVRLFKAAHDLTE